MLAAVDSFKNRAVFDKDSAELLDPVHLLLQMAEIGICNNIFRLPIPSWNLGKGSYSLSPLKKRAPMLF